MRRFFRAVSRYRPRLLTLALLALTAGLITLSKLSAEQSLPQRDWMAFGHKSYGWPLIWHRYILCNRSRYTVGWYVSYRRLAGNLAIWLVILVVPAAIAEWLMRRYRPRLRWSLRTMLAAVVLIALGCGWLAHARDRANVEDALITVMQERGEVWMERWGPRWLDLVGADRFRRRIVGVSLGSSGNYFGDEPDDPQLLKDIARLDGLRHLHLRFEEWTPEFKLAETLGALPRLRSLNIYGVAAREWQAAVEKMSRLEHLTVEHDAGLCACLEGLPNLKSLAVSRCHDLEDSHRLLATVGTLKNLEELWLTGMAIRRSDLACLSGLRELRFLGLSAVHENPSSVGNFQKKSEGGLLLNLPLLARLEAIDLEESEIYDGDIVALTKLPRLRWLNLAHTRITEVGLLQLASAARWKSWRSPADRFPRRGWPHCRLSSACVACTLMGTPYISLISTPNGPICHSIMAVKLQSCRRNWRLDVARSKVCGDREPG